MENAEKYTRYYSNGKLLISGEYAVIDGATALAIPLKFGQSLEIEQILNTNILRWEAYVKNKLWFFVEYNIENLSIIKTNISLVAEKLIKILKTIIETDPIFKQKLKSKIVTHINFNHNWGLGTSSTLISNLAFFAKTNPYNLLNKISNGSGYDIAAARETKPFLYTITDKNTHSIEIVDFANKINNNLYFIYLGKKQNTETSLNNYKTLNKITNTIIDEITEISKYLASSNNIETFNKAIFNHEEIISNLIGKKPIQKEFFSDFEGQIKSLGAWGGDFILASTENNSAYVNNYFKNKRLTTILKYNDITIKNK
jgi:mevalonate kinase